MKRAAPQLAQDMSLYTWSLLWMGTSRPTLYVVRPKWTNERCLLTPQTLPPKRRRREQSPSAVRSGSFPALA